MDDPRRRGLVLVAAIANAGSLGLSELFVRHNELLVRQSLGATPGRIARMLVAEAVTVLAMIGVYGILALFVSSRRRELALRIALGASAAEVFRLVLTQGLRLAGAGIGIGLAASLVLGRFLEAMLYGVRRAGVARGARIPPR